MKFLAAISILAVLISSSALAESSRGDLARAQEIFEELLEKTPDDPDIYEYLADIYFATGRLQKAKNFYLECVSRRPSYYAPFYRIGEIFWSLGDKKEAKKYFSQALGLMPKEKRDIQAGMAAARMEALLGNIKISNEIYDKLLTIYPSDLGVTSSRIDTLLDIGHVNVALGFARDAVSQYPNNIPLGRGLARALLLKGNYAPARRIISQLMKEHPDDFSLKADYAALLYNEGKWDLAWPIYKELSEATPDNLEFSKILDELFRDYRPRLTMNFDITLNASDRKYGPDIRYMHPINSSFTLEAGYRLNRDTTTIIGYDPNFEAFTHSANLLAHYKPHRELEFNLEMMNQIVDTSYFPGVRAWVIWDNQTVGRFRLGSKYNEMFDDPVAALYFDGRNNSIGISYEKLFFKRIAILAGYESIWRRVNAAKASLGLGDDFGREDTADAEAHIILFKRPEIRIGYQFLYANLHVVNNYLGIIPLIQASEQNNIMVRFSHEWNRWISTDIGGFVGNDSKRDLQISHLDLYGFNVASRLRLSKRLELSGHYEYSSENIFNAIGRYQFFGIGAMYRF